MSEQPRKSLALVISAIKRMQERRGSSTRDILNYISSVCDVPRSAARRQVLTALKRGTTHGILRETDGHYSLPTDASCESLEVASQELGLLDLSCRKRKQEERKRKTTCAPKRTKRRRSRSRRKSSSRGMRGCGSTERRKRSRKRKKSKRTRKSRSKYDCVPASRRSRGSRRRSKKRSKRARSKKRNRPCTCPPRDHQKSDKC